MPTFDALRGWFNEREIIELTATIAAYNMVARFLEALGLETESGAQAPGGLP
jgi:alkylhydroperoxidase family enzyme